MAQTAVGSVFIDFRAGVASFDRDLKNLQKSFNNTAKSLGTAGDSLFKAVSLPVAGATLALGKMTDSFQKAQRILQQTGGATGEALAKLKSDFEAVAGAVPNSMQDSAKAIAQVETRTGKTGEAAQSLAKQFLNLSTSGADLNETLVKGLQLFDTWGIKGEDQGKTLDMIYRAAQASGGSIQDFIGTLSGADAIFQNFGVDITQAATYLANFERAGFAGEDALGALNKAMLFFSKNGIKDMGAGLESAIAKIKSFGDDSSSAIKFASEVFGAKKAVDIVDAIQEGRFEFNDFLKDIAAGSETINGAAEKNRTLMESVAILGNQLNIAIAPLGDSLVAAFTKMQPAIQSLITDFAGLVSWFAELSPATQAATIEVIAFSAALGPLLNWTSNFLKIGAEGITGIRALNKVLDTSAKNGGTLALVFSKLTGSISTVFGLFVPFLPLLAAIATAVGVLALANENFGKIIVGLITNWKDYSQAIADYFAPSIDAVSTSVSAFAESFSRVFNGSIETLGRWWKAGAEAFSNFIRALSETAGWIADHSKFLMFVPGFTGINAAAEGLRNIQSDTEKTIGVISKLGTGLKENVNGTIAAVERGADRVNVSFGEIAAHAEELKKNREDATATVDGWAKELDLIPHSLADIVKGNEKVDKSQGGFIKTGKDGLPDLTGLLEENKKAADEVAKAMAGIQKETVKLVNGQEIEKLKDGLTNMIQGNTDETAYFTSMAQKQADALVAANQGAFDKIGEDYYNTLVESNKEAIDKSSGDQREALTSALKEQAGVQLDIYKNDILKQQLAEDKRKHTESISFWSGLMEDAISGTRFDLKEQLEKAFVEAVAIFVTRMLEANILAANSFGEVFDIAVGSLKGTFGEFFKSSGLSNILGSGTSGGNFLSSIFGGGSSAMSLSSSLDFASTEVASSGMELSSALSFGAESAAGSSETLATALDFSATASTEAATASTGFAGSLAATAIPLAAVAGGAYALYDSYNRLTDAFGSNSSNETKGTAVGTAGLDVMFPGLGTIASKGLDLFGLGGGNALTPNQQSLKKFESTIEDALKKSFGRSFNFVIGDIDQFSDPNWSADFWTKFGDKGGSTFDALGKAFEKQMNLEPGTGGQIGALLAQNLAGGNSNESLDNIKSFMDAIGMSTQQLTESIFQMGKTGEITWKQFVDMKNSLAQIPTEGLAGFADMNGALLKVLESSGKGMDALIGLKDLAVEAGEGGVTSLEGLQLALQDAGYDASTLGTLFASFAQNGITSLDDLKNASDETLAGIVAAMENGGIKWEDWAKSAEDMNSQIGNLADQIRNLASAFDKIPDSISIDIDQNVAGTSSKVATAGRGALLKFADGGLLNGPTMFQAQGMMGLAGEAGPEMFLPATRVNGRLGLSVAKAGVDKSSGGNIYIDARGADAGVEQRLMRMAGSIRDSAVSMALTAQRQQGRRNVY